MDILGAALISFVGMVMLMKHIPKTTFRRMVGYKGLIDVVLHGTIIWMFIGTSTMGLMQAELCGIMFSIYLRGYAKLAGYERRVDGVWMFYPGVMSK